MRKQPKISIVGAGPGDPDLITVKGLKAIEGADVILYDALANKELLESAPNDCRMVYVGKRAGEHKMRQEKINELLVLSARKFGHVVRLKGGDPFIFGRGHEEVDYIRQSGIEVSIIPGISSATSLPLIQGVPLTKRGISDGFWVITGTKANLELSKDISIAIKTSATIVILMGISKINEISDLLIQNGREDVPIMIIQNGSLPNEKYVIGTALDIVEKVQLEKIGRPGIIVIGEVVKLHPSTINKKIKSLWRA